MNTFFIQFGFLKRSSVYALILSFVMSFLSIPSVSQAATLQYTKTYLITAYYSPLPDQSHYFRGDYASEIRFNGNGTNGASGKEVFPGMIAAPPSYPFGTKMHIPGVGVVSVQDRGGRIQTANGSSRSYDRLDIWMGRGEEGLQRALAWGARIVEVDVYGIDPDMAVSVDLSSLNLANISRYKVTRGKKTFNSDVYFKSKGEAVRTLQKHLKNLGFFDHEITGYYGETTRDAVIEFQIAYGVIQSPDDFGAGHFGINSRFTIDRILDKDPEMEDKKLYILASQYPDLKETEFEFSESLFTGKSGDSVRMLQEELSILGYLRLEPTGFFGDNTHHAVFKFQQAMGLVAKNTDSAAGYVGPSTRKLLNEIRKKRLAMKSSIAQKRLDAPHLSNIAVNISR